MEYYNAARLNYKIERLPARLNKVLGDLPPLSGKPAGLEDEYSALFGFVKRVENLSQRVIDDKSFGTGEDKAKKTLQRICSAAAGKLGCLVSMIKKDVSWAHETRAFMLNESKKRVLQIIEDLDHAPPKSILPPPDLRPASTSESSTRTSQRSEAVPIGGRAPHASAQNMPDLTARRQTIGNITPIRLQSPNRNASGGASPAATPRVRNVVRIGSFQNANLFSGSPVAVAIRRRMRDPSATPTPATTPPATLRGKDYFSKPQPIAR